MDGFDDLLAPSRHALEENPFEDPFAKRSNSPDPWSSFNQQLEPGSSVAYSNDAYHPAPEPGGSTTPTESFVTAERDEPAENDPSDPLDAAALQAIDEDEEPLAISHSHRSPGFIQSIPSDFSEIATIRPTLPEESESSVTTLSIRETVSPPPHKHPSTGPSAPIVPSSPSTSAFPPPSPLEQPTFKRSFASLALGGETVGGWQGPQSPLVNDRPHMSGPSADDSDDDKPLRQAPRPVEPTVSTPTTKGLVNFPPQTETGLQPVFVISVEDPQKVGDPIRSFTMYTVHTRTTSPLFEKSSFSVLRRYSDFLWLYETLSVNNPGVVVPPVPEKNPFGRFDDNFVRQRRVALEKCIRKIANHPVLGKDADLKMFLESDSFALDIKHRKAEIAHERGGLMASLGQTIAGPRFHETDEWFDRKKGYLDSLESQLRGLVKAIELVAKQRAEVAVATGEFSQAVSDLASSDVGKQLSLSFSGLADVQRTAQELHNTQSEQDIATIMSTVDEYARLINSVRLAFSSRVRIYHAWQTADGEVRRVKQTHEKNRSQGRIPPERLGFSLSQIAEAERRALEAKHEFDHVSKLVKSEVARFEHERIEDFKDSLRQFLEGMISRQKQLIGAWESYQQVLLKRVGGRPQGIVTAGSS